MDYYDDALPGSDVMSSRDLYSIGLSRPWGKLMDEVGFETFVLVWRALEDPRGGAKLRRGIAVPKFQLFKEHLLKRFIFSLKYEYQMTDQEIKSKVLFVFGEEINVCEQVYCDDFV
jgi:hypothetical protein